MASGILIPERSSEALPAPVKAQKPQRVLACVLCQQRKVKCDRKFPCANCIKSDAQCLSASLIPRQRRRRFPERELLNRLRHYEEILTKNNIPFEPLHASTPAKELSTLSEQSANHSDNGLSPGGTSSRGSSSKPVNEFQPKNFWHAMNRRLNNSDNDDSEESEEEFDYGHPSSFVLRQYQVKKAWDELYDSNDHLLFCSRNMAVSLTALHPPAGLIFKLWQTYLDNVNPLLKVTHTPTLQPRVLDAASDVTKIEPALEALMFGIYCISVLSLSQDECYVLFGEPRQDILRRYQLGAREALLNCGFLRSSDRDCLTALHFYLIAIKPGTDPRALCSMLGAALRNAQRMGIHSEAANAKHSIFEAEMRRRLWWSLVLFDARISEMTEFKVGMLLPTWDCGIPLNVNDSDLRPEMKSPPTIYGQPSDAIFAVVRSQFGHFLQHSAFHLDFVNPALKPIAKGASTMSLDTDELAALETMFEEEYLKTCDSENPLHFMTIWMARGFVAKSRFVQNLSIESRELQTDKERDAGIKHALKMLECDTKLMKSPIIKGFRWLIFLNFPFPAYVHLVEDLRKRPLGPHADEAWRAMSNNCSARFMDIENKDNPMERKDNPFFKIFAGVVFQAWAVREAALTKMGQNAVPPLIVSQVKKRMVQMDTDSQRQQRDLQDASLSSGGVDLIRTDPVELNTFGSLNDMEENDLVGMHPVSLPNSELQAPLVYESNQWGWPAANWNMMFGHGW